MSDIEKKSADKVRAIVASCSDAKLFYFAHAIHSGEIKPEPLESVSEFIERASTYYIENLPF